jgi:hypothetical protein
MCPNWHRIKVKNFISYNRDGLTLGEEIGKG